MPNISKDTFSAGKRYRKVIIQQQSPVMDFDLNEAQDIAADERDRIVSQMAEGLHLLGSGGELRPHASAARTVRVEPGIAVHNGNLIRIPEVSALEVFEGSTGQGDGEVSSLVYVTWYDEVRTFQDDADIHDPTFGESGARIRRVVEVAAVLEGTTLPSPAGGQNNFPLGIVTHDFNTGVFLVLPSGISQDAAPTPGELGGLGPERTLRLISNADLSLEDALVLDTRNERTSGSLVRINNDGVAKATFDKDGQLALGKPGLPTAALDVEGDIAVSGTVDGINISEHTHRFEDLDEKPTTLEGYGITDDLASVVVSEDEPQDAEDGLLWLDTSEIPEYGDDLKPFIRGCIVQTASGYVARFQGFAGIDWFGWDEPTGAQDGDTYTVIPEPT